MFSWENDWVYNRRFHVCITSSTTHPEQTKGINERMQSEQTTRRGQRIFLSQDFLLTEHIVDWNIQTRPSGERPRIRGVRLISVAYSTGARYVAHKWLWSIYVEPIQHCVAFTGFSCAAYVGWNGKGRS